MAVVETSMQFLTREELYEDEKPYRFMYNPPDGIARTNYQVEKQEKIKISSIRGQEHQFSLEKNGFTVLKLDQDLPYEDFDEPAGIQRYLELLANQLRRHLDANKVQVYQCVIRKRDPSFPAVEEGKEYTITQPSTVAHIDITPEGAETIFQGLNGNTAATSSDHRFEVINIWKPLRGPLRDWPLALCDATSVQADQTMPADLVYEDKVTENVQVHHDKAHKWYYLQDQEASELLVFRQAESHPMGRCGVPHSSFPNPYAGPDEMPRESIEARTLVSY